MLLVSASLLPAPLSAAPGDDEADPGLLERLFVDTGVTLARVGLIVAISLAAWVVGRLVIRGIVRGIRRGASRIGGADEMDRLLSQERLRSRARTIGQVLRATLGALIFAVAVLMVLAELGVSVAPVLASAGIVGVALGFGAQSLVRDLLSGLFMLIEDQYGVGDVVDLGEASGVVEEFGLRSTQIRSLDGTVWFVPNGEIRRVGNMTQLWSRAMVEARLDFTTDVDAARQAMLDAVAQAAADDPAVAAALLGEPEVAGVEALDYNSVMLRLLVQVKPTTQWTVMRAVRQRMRDLFLERGIALAAPESAVIQDAPRPTPRRATPKQATPKQATPKRATPKQASPKRKTAPRKK